MRRPWHNSKLLSRLRIGSSTHVKQELGGQQGLPVAQKQRHKGRALQLLQVQVGLGPALLHPQQQEQQEATMQQDPVVQEQLLRRLVAVAREAVAVAPVVAQVEVLQTWTLHLCLPPSPLMCGKMYCSQATWQPCRPCPRPS